MYIESFLKTNHMGCLTEIFKQNTLRFYIQPLITCVIINTFHVYIMLPLAHFAYPLVC